MLTVEDHREISETLSLHGHLFDEGELDRLDRIFTADVVYDLTEIGMGELRGIAEIRAAAEELGAANPVAHHVTNIVITADGEDRADARSKGIAVKVDGSCGSATYLDTLRREDGRWRIERRTILSRRTPLTR